MQWLQTCPCGLLNDVRTDPQLRQVFKTCDNGYDLLNSLGLSFLLVASSINILYMYAKVNKNHLHIYYKRSVSQLKSYYTHTL